MVVGSPLHPSHSSSVKALPLSAVGDDAANHGLYPSSQTMMLLSSEADAARRPSGENATLMTLSLWPLNDSSGPVPPSPPGRQARTLQLSPSHKANEPSGEMATLQTVSWKSDRQA